MLLLKADWLGRKFLVVQGDITEQDTQAIVNAANSFLKHGGGIAGAIVRAGGEVIQEESSRIVEERGPVPVGRAIYTTGGNLKADFVIHAVGPVWGEGDEERKLRSAVRSALEIASQLGVTSVSIPAISTGIFGYPKEEGVRVIVDESLKFFKENPNSSVREVRFVALDPLTANLFALALKARLKVL